MGGASSIAWEKNGGSSLIPLPIVLAFGEEGQEGDKPPYNS